MEVGLDRMLPDGRRGWMGQDRIKVCDDPIWVVRDPIRVGYDPMDVCVSRMQDELEKI